MGRKCKPKGVSPISIQKYQNNYEKYKEQLILAANEYGVPPRDVVLIAGIESAYKTEAKSSTTAVGLGQFVERTFISVVKNSKHPELRKIAGLNRQQILNYRSDPRIGALALAEHTRNNRNEVEKAFKAYNIKSEVTLADIYAVHNIGNPQMAVNARLGLGVKGAVSSSAMSVNAGLYAKGMNSKAETYMKEADRRLVEMDWILNKK